MPSLASSLWKSCCWSSRSTASPVSKGISAPVCTDLLIRPTAFDAFAGGVNPPANSRTFAMKSSPESASITRLMMPWSSASAKPKSCPVVIISMERDLPTRRASRWVPPVPGSTPRLISGSPMREPPARATRRSHAIAISSPPPTVCPLSAPMVSFGVCSRRLRVSLA